MNRLLTKLRQLNIEISLVDNKLKVNGPEGVITKDILSEIKEYKDELIAHVKQIKNKREFLSITKATDKDYFELSSAQKRMYFLNEFDPESLMYNMPQIIILEGKLDKKKLNSTFTALIKRHESLRTSFEIINGRPVQIISDQVAFSLDYFQTAEKEVESFVKNFIKPFDLTQSPLFRVAVIENKPDRHVLVIDMHHIITDGISQSILIKDFIKIYGNDEPSELTLQYKDFSEWQNSEAQQQQTLKQRDFWLTQFSEEITPLELPIDFHRPSVNTYEGNALNFELDKDKTKALKTIAEKEGKTMFMVLLAAFNILLSKLTNQEEVIVGTPVAGRQHAELENVMGMFVNTLPLRNLVLGNLSFSEFLSSIKEQTINSFQNQDFQYEQLIDELKITRNTSRNPLFDVMFVYQNYDEPTLELPDLTVRPMEYKQGVAKFDLSLAVSESDSKMLLTFEYSTNLFKKETIERFVSYFERIVEGITDNPKGKISAIDILSVSERTELLIDFNNTFRSFPKNQTVVSYFEKHAKNSPDNIALVCGDTKLTYEELNNSANNLAFKIKDRIEENENHCIALYFEPTIEVVVSIFAIAKLGCAFVPLAVDAPNERNAYILSDCNARLLLTQEGLMSDEVMNDLQMDRDSILSVGAPDRELKCPNPNIELSPTDLIYIIYTSGTTGQPKGVEIMHQSLFNYASWRKGNYDVTPNDVTLQLVKYQFDGYITNLFLPLTSGASMVIVPEEMKLNTKYIGELISTQKVTNMGFTPGLYDALLNDLSPEEHDYKGLRFVAIGGEKPSVGLLRKSKKIFPDLMLANEYGPTETTVASTCNMGLTEFNASVIGRPIANTSVYILGKENELLPKGVYGEICISGEGLARGYVNNQKQTLEKFIKNPFVKGGFIYKTGDVGRWLPDGNIEIQGRTDEQVKIRGFRIELGEIEAQLSNHHLISECTIIPIVKNGDKYLVAYYVSKEQIEITELRGFLLGKLPDYMVPAHWVHLTSMPYTINGKIDKRGLPEPSIGDGMNYVAPVTPQEKLLAKIWSEVLGIENVGVTDNFFSLGGDSIKSIQISSRMGNEGYEVSVKDIFTYQAIRELAPKIKAIKIRSEQSVVEGEVPLTGIQHWLLENPNIQKHHFNQSMLLNFESGISKEIVIRIFEKLQEHHDALRMVFTQKGGKYIQENRGLNVPVSVAEHDLSNLQNAEDKLAGLINEIQSGIDISNGPLMKLGLFHMKEGSRLFIVIHHLVVDGVSWRILFEDIESVYAQVMNNKPLKLPLKTDSYQLWSNKLQQYCKSDKFAMTKDYWISQIEKQSSPIPRDYADGSNSVEDSAVLSFQLDQSMTSKLLKEVRIPFNTQINDLLLAALLISIEEQFGLNSIKVDLEGHGREDIDQDINISRTVGWFTTIYPVLLENTIDSLSEIIKTVKETLRKVPNNGLDYLLLKYLNGDDFVDTSDRSSISFNYLGQFDTDITNKYYSIAQESKGEDVSRDTVREYDWDITGIISNGALDVALRYSQQQYDKDTIDTFLQNYQQVLVNIIDFCINYDKVELTPSDLSFKDIPLQLLTNLQGRYNLTDVYPLSPMQEGMLFHDLLDSEAGHYFGQMTYDIKGSMDIEAVQRSLNDIVERYPVLRTNFINDVFSRPLQIVQKDRNIDFKYIDVRKEVANSSRDEIIKKYKSEDKSNKFDLSCDVLMRVTAIQLLDNEFIFIWSHHHIIMDGWCMGIIIREFKQLYAGYINGQSVELPAIKPYAKYIQWLEERDQKDAEQYWKNYLSSYENLATIPKKEGALSEGIPFELASEHLVIDGQKTKNLYQISRDKGVTLNNLIQVSWGILLAKYNNTNDVVFASIVSGRPTEINGVETMVGLFINAVPVRVDYEDGDSIEKIFKKVQKREIDGVQYHYSPLSAVQSLSDLGRGLMDHIMVFEDYPIAQQLSNGATEDSFEVSNVQVAEQTNYDLTLTVIPGSEINIEFDYNKAVYDQATIQRLKIHFEHVIDQILTDLNVDAAKIQLITDEEEQQIVTQFNDTFREMDNNRTFSELFEQQVAITPEKIAAEHKGDQITYQDLFDESELLGQYLASKGVGTNKKVALYMPRGIDMLKSILAIFKAGGAYVPIDVEYPINRTREILEDSGAEVVITLNESAKDILDLKQGLSLDIEIVCADDLNNFEIPPNHVWSSTSTQDLAYMIYTSGTTGKPKGVMIHQLGMINHLNAKIHDLGLTANDIIAQSASPCFDISVWQFLAGLLIGAKTYIIDKDTIIEAKELISDLQKGEVTIFESVPSLITTFLDELPEGHDNSLEKLRWMIPTGEPLSITLVKKWYSYFPDIKLLNAYGPTEASDDVTHHIVSYPDESQLNISIGKPIQNTHIYIFDKQYNLCPVGVKGEICVAGLGVGKGYWNNIEKTNQAFVSNPMNGKHTDLNYPILYKTGDIGYYLESGEIICLGRIDEQVKIRGFRIELGEITAQLSKHALVDEAAVVAKEKSGDKYLAAYYISQKEIDTSQLKKHLLQDLPEYMIPPYFVRLEKMPVTRNGKLDKSALPEPELETQNDYIAPTNEVEQALVDIWSEILTIDKTLISIKADFFELGGHSLKATALVNKIYQKFEVQISLRELFNKPTLEEVADYIITIKQPEILEENTNDIIELTI